LVTLGSFLFVALALVGLRHHHLELTSQSAKLFEQIQDRTHTLWGQEAVIAEKTNPIATAKNFKSAGLDTTAFTPNGALTQPAPKKTKGTSARDDGDLIAPLRRGQ
jgi:hypothetical protein